MENPTDCDLAAPWLAVGGRSVDCLGAVYMLPASGSGEAWAVTGDDATASEGSRPARNLSTIAAISSRLTLPPLGTAAGCCTTAGAREGCGAELTVCADTAGRALFTGLVSKATRLMSIRWSGETLSEVTLPPHEPHPNVIDGGSAVENPIAP